MFKKLKVSYNQIRLGLIDLVNTSNLSNCYSSLSLKSEIMFNHTQLMHPKDMPANFDPTGWWASEKFDGCRALWDGDRFISKNGHEFVAPEWFKQAMPQDVLDGELYVGKNSFVELLSYIGRLRPRDFDWAKVSFKVFDAPEVLGIFEERYIYVCGLILSQRDIWKGLKKEISKHTPMAAPIHPVFQTLIKDREQFKTMVSSLLNDGSEGVVIRAPKSLYVPGYSNNLFKLKDHI